MTTEVFVYTKNSSVGAWSRYLFPFPIHEYRQLGNNLYIRSGDDILRVSEDTNQDFHGDDRASYFDGVVQWPWLDFGSAGADKMMEGFNVVMDGVAQINFGYDEGDFAAFTEAYEVDGDTVPKTMIPYEMTAPSFSMKMTFVGAADNYWKVSAAALYLQDNRPGS